MITLSPKRQRFVDEYLVDMNGAQAAIRAGYSPSTAKVTASRLLTNDNVAEAIASLRGKLAKKLEISAERVLTELARIGFANLSDYYRVDVRGDLAVNIEALVDPSRASAVAQIDIQTAADGSQTIKLKLADKRTALVDLGKHLGLFCDTSRVMMPEKQPDEVDPRLLAMAIIATIREGADAVQLLGPLIDEEERQSVR